MGLASRCTNLFGEGGIEGGLVFEHCEGDAEEAVGDTAKRTSVAVTAGAQRGVFRLADRVMPIAALALIAVQWDGSWDFPVVALAPRFSARAGPDGTQNSAGTSCRRHGRHIAVAYSRNAVAAQAQSLSRMAASTASSGRKNHKIRMKAGYITSYARSACRERPTVPTARRRVR